MRVVKVLSVSVMSSPYTSRKASRQEQKRYAVHQRVGIYASTSHVTATPKRCSERKESFSMRPVSS